MDAANFLITNKCNLKCKHCFVDRSKEPKDIPLDIFKKVLNELEKYGVNHIALTGGEPFLHEKFEDVLAVIADEGFTFKIVSNGFLFEENIHLIKEFQKNLARMCFSVDGAISKTHDFIRGKGSFKRVMKSINLCNQLGIKVTMQFTVNRKNFDEFEKIVSLALEKKVNNLYIHSLIPPLKGSNKILEDLILNPGQRANLARKIAVLQKYTRGKIGGTASLYKVSRRNLCRALNFNSVSIDINGNLIFCCNIHNNISGLNLQPAYVTSLKTHSLIEGLEILSKKIKQIQVSKLKDMSTGKYNSWSECDYCLHKLGYDIYHKE